MNFQNNFHYLLKIMLILFLNGNTSISLLTDTNCLLYTSPVCMIFISAWPCPDKPSYSRPPPPPPNDSC